MKNVIRLVSALALVALVAACEKPAPSAPAAPAAVAPAPAAPAAVASAPAPAAAPAAPAPAAAPVAAPAPAAAAAPAAPAAEVATFSVPGLDEAVAKQLAVALGSEKGVVSAKPDLAAAKFLVTFTPGATNPPALLKILTGVKAEATFVGVAAAEGGAAPAPAHDCGGCPHRKTCGGAN